MMDKELKQYLDAKFAEMDRKFATKQDLAEIHLKSAALTEARDRTHAAVLRVIDLELGL